MAAGLSALPTELLITLLHTFELCDLLKCCLVSVEMVLDWVCCAEKDYIKVSRSFYEIIQNDKSLQYKIELASAGLINAPFSDSPLSIASRLDVLKAHTARWRDLDWQLKNRITLRGRSLYELFGGVFARDSGYERRGLSFVRLPSVIADTKAVSWQHLDMGFAMKDFSMDPAQDLLIVVQQQETRLARGDIRGLVCN
jgi:hypothetical protein